jgi:hypothetical protein
MGSVLLESPINQCHSSSRLPVEIVERQLAFQVDVERLELSVRSLGCPAGVRKTQLPKCVINLAELHITIYQIA